MGDVPRRLRGASVSRLGFCAYAFPVPAFAVCPTRIELSDPPGLRGELPPQRRRFVLDCQGIGYSGAEVARLSGVTTSSVNRLAVSEELPTFRKYINTL